MTSILKVDTIQTAAGGTPTAADLGLNVTGSVLQVVSATKTNPFAVTGTTWTDVNLSLSITPTSTSSKILVLGNVFLGSQNASGALWRLVRDTTAIAVNSFVSQPMTGGSYPDGSSQTQFAWNGTGVNYLDSPSTTSALTYKIQLRCANTNTAYLNRRGYDADYGGVSGITAIEIAG